MKDGLKTQDPNVVLEHPDGRKIYPDGRIVVADGSVTDIETIRKERERMISIVRECYHPDHETRLWIVLFSMAKDWKNDYGDNAKKMIQRVINDINEWDNLHPLNCRVVKTIYDKDQSYFRGRIGSLYHEHELEDYDFSAPH